MIRTMSPLILLITMTGCASLGSNFIKESQWNLQKEYSSYFLYKKAKINFIKIGKGDPLILIHGGGSWSYSFRNNIIPLSKYFTVYTIDIPGHGYSEIPTNFDFTLQSINKLLLEFLKYNNIEKANFVGNSWGGGWVIYFTERNPNKVKKLILIDSSGLTDSNKYDKSLWKYLSFPGGKLLLYFVTKNSVKNSYEKELFFNRKLITDDMVNEIYEPLHYKDNLLAQQKYQINLHWEETGNNLKTLRNVIIIWGRHDKYLPLTMIEKYKEQIPEVKEYIMDASSHLPHEEEYDKVNAIIIAELTNSK